MLHLDIMIKTILENFNLQVKGTSVALIGATEVGKVQ